ncbi:hypothetical protein E2C01_035356 [Portunus trituberculatus]|uniref:Uncharacterized protein n=1 Tax=Portunus trituberculatus TaxID=210409 RepID=A0A5B7FB93_PORTR|nr:hypothetical protein [Portunus trituberculatus]
MLRKRVRNVHLHARHYYICYVFGMQRWVSDMETVTIPGKISTIPPQVPPTGGGKNTRGSSALGDPEEGLEK